MEHAFTATSRSLFGTSAAKRYRKNQHVPCVAYNSDKKLIHFVIDSKVANKIASYHGVGRYNMRLDDTEQYDVLLKEIDRHPVTDMPRHFGFVIVGTQMVKVSIPVAFVNKQQSPGLKQGGILAIVKHRLLIRCLPSDIPEAINVDLTGFGFKQKITIANLEIPPKIQLMTRSSDDLIATILASSGAVSDKAAK